MASWCNDPEFPSDERVTRTRDALAKAKTESQAMIALSDADTATLREIEAEYFFHPGSAEDLRERIVAAHLQYISMMGAQALHTKLVTSDVVAGPWQSGPSFSTQNVTDNLDGTETVTVTDNLLVSASPAHYLRVRISVP